jgi:hypothetical protein
VYQVLQPKFLVKIEKNQRKICGEKLNAKKVRSRRKYEIEKKIGEKNPPEQGRTSSHSIAWLCFA